MKLFRLTLPLCAVILSGCALSPGAHLDPHGSSAVDFNLIDISEKNVLAEPVSRQDLIEKLGFEEASRYTYRVGAHDVLSIRVWNSPDLTTDLKQSASAMRLPAASGGSAAKLVAERQQVTPEGVEVSAAGDFFYPYAGTVSAQGKTVEEIRKTLTLQLSEYVVDPQVSVKVQEYNSQQVQVLGEVTTPRPLAITSKPLRILDALALAQGLRETADKVEAVLLRQGERVTISLAALLDGDLSQNYLMNDGDVLNVDSNRYRQIVIMGEVVQPVAIPYDPRGLSLNDALVAARGINQNLANAKGVYILRSSKTGNKASVYRLDMKNATGLLLADRFPLQARDVVYVDTAGISRWNRVISQLLPTSQAFKNANSINNDLK